MKYLSNLDLTFKRIAQLNNVASSTVQLYLDSYVSIPRTILPENLGIDELYSKSMSNSDSAYLCILVDNHKRYPIDILPSRSKNYLNSFFSKYSKTEREKVKFVTIDMWKPYKDVVLRQFPNCQIAVDPFHVVKNLSDIFIKIRRTIMNQVPYGSDYYYLLKKWFSLIDKYDIDLDNEPRYNARFNRKLNKRQLFDMILEISDKLKEAYQLKVMYQIFNERATVDNCEEWLDIIISRFSRSSVVEYIEFTNLLINWKQEIINSFNRPHNDRKQSNALAEATNSKLRAYLDMARGTQNFTRFRKRVLLATNPKIFYSISNHLESDKNFKSERGKYNKK